MTSREGFERIGAKAGALASVVEGATGLAVYESFVTFEHESTLAVVAAIFVVPGCTVGWEEENEEEEE